MGENLINLIEEVSEIKKKYLKPELNNKAFAQFENVFTKCDKGNAHKKDCSYAPGWPPSGKYNAAYGGNPSIS